MFLNIGQQILVPYANIIGIFDLDNSSWSHITRKFLEKAEREKNVISVSEDLPRSFIVLEEKDGRTCVYLSPFSTKTLLKRVGEEETYGRTMTEEEEYEF